MQRVDLGTTGLVVSRLSVGTDTRLPVREGAHLLRRALELGINFWDTDESYGTQPCLGAALRGLDRSQVVIATKTYRSDGKGVRRSLERALTEIGTEYIDIFHLHAMDSMRQFKQHAEALEVLLGARERGLVRAVGLSTHNVKMMEAIPDIPEIEVILTVLNRSGARIGGGSREEMEKATQRAYEADKGVYLMKVLARGRLAAELESALSYALDLPYVHSACVGMRNIKELEMNMAVANRLMGMEQREREM